MQIKLQRNINASSGQGFTDGFTCVADLNHDGIQEVIVPGFRNQIIGIFEDDTEGGVGCTMSDVRCTMW